MEHNIYHNILHRKNLPHSFLELMNLYQSELIKWNHRTDLIGNSTTENFFDRHIINSLQLVTFFKERDEHIADIGTGAGLPGLVCAAYDQKRKYYLFEKKKQKLIFLKHMQVILNLNNIEIMGSFSDKSVRYFDVLTSRALLSIHDIMSYKNKVKRIILFKGKDYIQEIKHLNGNHDVNNMQIFNAYNDDSFFLQR